MREVLKLKHDMLATITRTWPTACEAAFLALIGDDPHHVRSAVMKNRGDGKHRHGTVIADRRRKREGTVTKRMDRHSRKHGRYLSHV